MSISLVKLELNKTQILNIFFLTLLYTYEFYDLSSSSWTTLCLSHTSLSTNVLLTNNINKYHPFIFYFSVVTLLNVYKKIRESYFLPHFMWSTKVDCYNIKRATLLGLISTFIALYLGSWWALQEGTWGGWWNWDASETFGLFLLFAFTRWTHLFNVRNFVYALNFSIRLFVVLFLILYFMMQLNFDLISHNFGIKFFFFFNNSIFFLEMLGIFLMLCIYMIYLYLFSNSNAFFFRSKKIKQRKPFKKTLFLIFYQVFILWVFLASFGPVISYFLWTYAKLNFFNEFGIRLLDKLLPTLVISISYVLVPVTRLVSVSILLIFFYSNFVFIIFFFFTWVQFLSKTHSFLFLFFLLGVQAPSTQLAHALLKTPFSLVSSLDCQTWVGSINFLFDEVSYFIYTSSYPNICSSLVIQTFLTTPLGLPFFGFFICSTLCTSTLFTLSEMFTFVNFIEVSCLSVYPSLVFLGLAWIIRIFFFKNSTYSF